MSDKETQKELESLRAEVAALSKARAKERRPKPEPEPAPQPTAAPAQSTAAAVVDAAAVDINDPDAVQTQMDKLLAQLENEIRDMPTITTLGVFSLGVLFGRLLR
jgi:hypothetical protein